MKLSDIARHLAARLEPPDEEKAAEVEIRAVAPIDRAGPGQLTFAASSKYVAAAAKTSAAALIVGDDFPAGATPNGTLLLRVRDPQLAFAKAIELFYVPPQYPPGVHPTAVIAESARIGRNAHVGAHVVIEDEVEIGNDCTLLPHVVIYRGARIGDNFFAHAHAVIREHCRIGNNVLLQNGVVIGGDGFGFVRTPEGWRKTVQAGVVEIEDDVEIQANACIDRATIAETRIGRGTKVDNLTHLAHNVNVGENSLLCAQVGIAGSTNIGKNVILTGQVGVVGHCNIGDNAVVTPQSGISGDVEPNAIVSGAPAVDHRVWMKYSALLPKLPELFRRVRALGGSTKEESEG
jgi:UDP-3-O-[3-hydroxymyristoyl] glucosamine N-acyltransferase